MDSIPALPHSRNYSATPEGSPPQRLSPGLLPPGSPMGVTLESKLPFGATFRHAYSCPNKMVNIGSRIVHPDIMYPQAKEALGCLSGCHIQMAGDPAHQDQQPIAAPKPGFRTALSKVFGDHGIQDIDPIALAEIAALASSYHPSQESAFAADPSSSPPDPMEHSPTPTPDIQVPHTQTSEQEETQDTAMSLESGKNTDGTGIGDSMPAPTSDLPSQPGTKKVRFSSQPLQEQAMTIPGTDSGNFTPAPPTPTEEPPTPMRYDGPSSSPSPSRSLSQSTPIHPSTTPNPTGNPQEILDAPITHRAMLAIMRDMEARFETRLRQMENRILSRRQEPATPRGPTINPVNNGGNSGKWTEDPPRRPGPPDRPPAGNV